MSGRGTVASYIIVHHPPIPWLDLPVAVATIALDEGPSVTSNVCEVAVHEVHLGMEVEVFFAPTDQARIGVPLFRPIEAG
jgi:uncharacterized OB-fold protein